MRKLYIAICLGAVFLIALICDWNTRQKSAQKPGSASMIQSRDDDLLLLEIGLPGGTAPASTKSPRQLQSNTVPHRVPHRKPSPAKQETGKRGDEEKGYYFYEVKAGDTLSEIAQRELQTATRVQEIIRLNGITDPKSIRPGDKLKIPRE
jgi:hypothetical protein